MKSLITALLFWLSGLIIPTLAAAKGNVENPKPGFNLTPQHLSTSTPPTTEGDYENRLREAELAGDRSGVRSICKEWYASGKFSSGLLNWNYNALMSVEQNALLFTQQESDTYPALLLQNALEIRPDIRVISFQLLEHQTYREQLIDQEELFWIPKNCSLNDFLDKILHPQFPQSAPTKPVYFGSMINKNVLEADKGRLYLTGLALKFSLVSFDNVATLRYNFENRFRTDYLNFHFEPEMDPAALARVNLNYIPALLLLHRHYAAAGETGKAARLQNLAMNIARAGNRAAEVSAFFAPEPPTVAILSDITPKVLLKNMKKVGDRLYASATEMTNAQYELFLEDLLKNKEFDQLANCRTTKTDWVSLLPKEQRTLPEKLLFEHGHPDGPDFPVQNISFEAAQQYCTWVTKVYNASTEKKTFKKVLFRLPTEAEWMVAAQGGSKANPYPWGGYYVRNAKGCYLGNYNATEPCGNCPGQTLPATASIDNNGVSPVQDVHKIEDASTAQQIAGTSNDGGFFPVKVESYYPNRFGLYAMSGNVAEMIAEPGKTKGGSWQDIPYYGQIPPVKTVDGPSPAVGFRLFMEVIEE